MKSIMEEASSVAKAIENGWARAGKPQEFTVKVFEEAQTSFFGLFTSKPAKIGLFFQESIVTQPMRHQKDRASQNVSKKYTTNTQTNTQPARPAQQRQPIAQQARPERAPKPELSTASTTTPWSPELIEAAQEWTKDSLHLMNLSSISFDTQADRYALKFTFSKPLVEISEKEKMLFRSWAYLIMQALRQKFKRPLKGLKVILTSNA